MKIYIGDKGNVDFDAPIQVTEEQAQKIINFFKELYREDIVEIDTSSEFRSDRLGDKLFQRRWSTEEYAALLELDKDTDELTEGLGRTWMSIDIKRGEWIPKFLSWARVNNKNFIEGNIKEIIKEYFSYLEEQKRLRKEEKRNLKKKRLESERKRLEKKLKSQFLLKKLHSYDKNIDRAIENTQRELEEINRKLAGI